MVEIEARALLRLKTLAEEAANFGKQWLALIERHPDRLTTHPERQIEALRQAVAKYRVPVRRELEQFLTAAADLPSKGAAQLALNGIEAFCELFEPSKETIAAEPPSRYLLQADLLLLDGLELDVNWQPLVTPSNRLLEYTLNAVTRGLPPPEEALNQALQTGNIVRADRIIKVEQSCPAVDNAAERVVLFQRRLEARVLDLDADLQRRIEEARKTVEQSVASGALPENRRNELLSEIGKIEVDAGKHLMERYDVAFDQLTAYAGKALLARQLAGEKQRRRLRQVADRLSEDLQKHVDDLLNRGEVLTATEYLDAAESGRDFTDDKPDDTLNRFLAAFDRIDRYVRTASSDHKILSDIRMRSGIEGVNLGSITSGQLDSALALVEAWLTLRRTRRPDGEQLMKVLAGLGFAPQPPLQMEETPRRTWVKFQQEPITRREQCPVPQFGSSAGGRYRVLCHWQRPSEDDLLATVGDQGFSTPPIVFYFGRMTKPIRRELAHLCRHDHRTLLVVDDILILFLCGERDRRLGSLFRCALPFTDSEPYSILPGLVPPEIFYGRVRERRAVSDPHGACYIYGGRQIGKTALLRNIQASQHKPEQGQIALWIDLKSPHEIGSHRPAKDIWEVLARELRQVGVLKSSFRERPTDPGQAFLESVAEWLDEQQDRRILLMLDEADNFLAQDGMEEFRNAAKLKSLMDRTERRFKVVLAGLHNVERTTRVANNPIPHYGDPICIGPLLEGGEALEARHLITEPLAACGYLPESDDVVVRILSQTNYYPNLIQLFCSQLLKHLHSVRFDEKETPPYKITLRHVEDAYQREELRRHIYNRFRWTLDLDHRYKAIALCIALQTVESGDALGFDSDWIRGQVTYYWPQGFQSIRTQDEFHALLDEMKGLGVLRSTGTGNYALRSLNVAVLMGTREQIETELLELEAEAPPAVFNAASFRSSLPAPAGEPSAVRKSPLTWQQLFNVLGEGSGVALVCGCEAGGLSELEGAIRQQAGADRVISVGGTNSREFVVELGGLLQARPEGTTVYLVGAGVPWTNKWVEEAAERVSKFPGQKIARVVFVADPATAWRFVADGYHITRTPQTHDVQVVTLGPWADAFLRIWLEEHPGAVANEVQRKRIERLTGNWPLVLYMLEAGVREGTNDWPAAIEHLDQHLNSDAGRQAMLRIFGLDQQREAFASLQMLAEFGNEPQSREILLELAPDVGLGPLEFDRSLQWAIALGMATVTDGDGVFLNPIVGRTLRPSNRDQ